ncbi:Alpha-amylase [Arcticibacter svalbardensis MN12-7]|uniref:Alpha-1,4-glucan:maltose-1-phosphate maltosyltransferase n=1 Tax=Arcticibacter svalbardensis MN12-7 TaxID=1150600 RepID=R9GS51_9SPHI|nr:alpha-1,4-glucan--maltose-1-phosphate maltosyltransferase [Arcticibacter svalbardensis]EOR94551.1 Alpha-amylase [Arcticibacter svalbardensis MN12-7]
MVDSKGRRRVIISNVSPVVEGGQYPAKSAVDEYITISADIFSDGHDEIAASVLVRHIDDPDWVEYPMSHIINDRWAYQLKTDKQGFYTFKVQGWVDHFITWQKGLKKKQAAGQDLSVDLQIGADLIEQAQLKVSKIEKAQIDFWISALKDPISQEDGVVLAMNTELTEVVRSYKDENLISLSPQHEIETERKKAAFSSWYELFPRSASAAQGEHGTFQDVQKLLPRVAKMGFDVLYFPPIHPIGEKNRKGKNNSLVATAEDPGSPWAIGNRTGGHKDIHPELGSLEDFKTLVEEAKKTGIEIAMDIAYQCAPDHPYVKDHPQWFKWRPDGSVQYAENPPKKYEDILPINFETEDWKDLWQELQDVILYWIDQGVRIFRIDNPHTKAFLFWEWMIAGIRKKYPDVIFLAEAFTRPRLMERLGKAGFTQSYTYFTWRNTKHDIEEYMNELVNSQMRFFFRPNFWPNTPDILPPELASGGENAHIMRIILASTLSSNYGIYGPVYEFGINTTHPGKEEYTNNEKYELKHWDWDRYTRIKEIITRINKIRHQNTALQTTWNIAFAETTNDQIISYAKKDPESGNIILVVVNLDVFNLQGAHIKLPADHLGIKPGNQYRLKDLLSGSTYTWQDEWNYVQLNPYEMPAHIFKLEPYN